VVSFYGLALELDGHLFVTCDMVLPALDSIYRWLGWELLSPQVSIDFFFLF
jgi:hypothetical protein